MIPSPPTSTLFPYTTLFRSIFADNVANCGAINRLPLLVLGSLWIGSLVPVKQKSLNRAVRVGERSEEHTSELQSPMYLVCRLLLEKKKQKHENQINI